MKPTKTKKEIRDEIDKQVEDFLRSGGSVNEVKQGISGNEANINLFKQTASFAPKQDRTPVTDVVKELEARKSNKNNGVAPKKKPRKVLITDDFGEPIRWVWEE